MRLLGALAVVVMLAFTGACGGKSVTVPGTDGKVKVDKKGETFELETEDGTLVVGKDSLPKTFPESDIPVVDGKVIQGVEMSDQEQDSWSVTVLPSGKDFDEAVADAAAKMEAAGFTQEYRSNTGFMESAMYKKDSYTVTVGVVDDDTDTGIMVQYLVIREKS